MAFRKKMTKRQSKRDFRRKSGVKKINYNPSIRRGGYRL